MVIDTLRGAKITRCYVTSAKNACLKPSGGAYEVGFADCSARPRVDKVVGARGPRTVT